MTPVAMRSWFVAFWGDGYPARMGAIGVLANAVTGRDFKHVTAFGFDPVAGCWLTYDVCWGSTEIVHLTPAQFDLWLAGLIGAGGRVLRVPDGLDEPRGAPLRGWCVPAVAHLVGSASRAWRPRALWRDLVASGSREVFGP